MRIMVAMLLLGARTSKEERNGTEEPKFALYGTGDPREEAFPRKGKWKKNERIHSTFDFIFPSLFVLQGDPVNSSSAIRRKNGKKQKHWFFPPTVFACSSCGGGIFGKNDKIHTNKLQNNEKNDNNNNDDIVRSNREQRRKTMLNIKHVCGFGDQWKRQRRLLMQ